MLLVIQIAVGIVVGGILLSFILSFINAYYELDKWNREIIGQRLSLIFGIPFIIALIGLGFWYKPDKTVAILTIIGTPFALLLSGTLIIGFAFRNHDEVLKTILLYLERLPILVRLPLSLMFYGTLFCSGAFVYFNFVS
ncbi:hypothetical protein N9K66_04020 [Planktomarina temperata]|nr:hypothetical protein [Planktomarina temperata]